MIEPAAIILSICGAFGLVVSSILGGLLMITTVDILARTVGGALGALGAR